MPVTVDDQETITRRVIVDAQRMFGDRADANVLEQYARQAMDELWTESVTITQFIPALALHRIRNALDRQQDGQHARSGVLV